MMVGSPSPLGWVPGPLCHGPSPRAPAQQVVLRLSQQMNEQQLYTLLFLESGPVGSFDASRGSPKPTSQLGATSYQ